MNRFALLLLGVAFSLSGCRAEPGSPPVYDEDWKQSELLMPEFLQGPEGYVDGEERMHLGIFYEGGHSDIILIDNDTVHYYLYVLANTDTPTVSQSTDLERVEGTFSDKIIHGGYGWWGTGVHIESGDAVDLSDWDTMHISLRSADPGFDSVLIRMESEGGNGEVDARDYGYTADGEWHSITIPMADLEASGLEPSTITSPIGLGGMAGEPGDSLWVDNLYLTKMP